MEPDIDLTAVATTRPLADSLLAAAASLDASDVHVAPGSAPVARVRGSLVALGEAVWGADAVTSFCRSLCNDRQWAEVEQVGTADFGISHGVGERYRVSVLRQRNGLAAVLRRIPAEVMSLEEIGLPPNVTDLLRRTRGLILVTGPTGSGKSSTLASMIDWINTNLERHIVTIEDPVEFYHHPKRSLVTQREVGEDVPSFAEAMRRVLRQDPDVIMLGEMRDLETIGAAVSAAETGHLVLATLHTIGSATTVSRIIDVFPAAQQAQIRVQLAMSLTAVLSQVLVPERAGDGPDLGRPPRVAALELMVMTPAIANMIRTNDINRINDVIQTSRHLGMFRLDEYLLRLVEQGRIESSIALGYAQDPAALGQRLGR
jgi:twitching motility protein PilT